MKTNLLKSVIYQVFVRNETKEGTFNALENKLEEIKENGCDILYVMPISPIGEKGRKGTLGSPYAIKDYEAINEEYGTLEDFKSLINKTHDLGMKIMMDIVFNHTSRDSVLIEKHEEFYYHDKDGKLGNRVGDWSDVYDLDLSREDTQDYLVSVLKLYESWGVDGFRFDVASFLPASFYKKAKKALNSRIILLAEAVDGDFLLDARKTGREVLSNDELFENGFDMCYHYANWHFFDEFLNVRTLENLSIYKATLEMEQSSIRENGLIVRAIENHDRTRICGYDGSDNFHKSLLAYSFFTRGAAFVYSGEESKECHTPSLFDKDTVTFNNFDKEYYDFYLKNIELKKRDINTKLIQSSFSQNKEMGIKVINYYSDGYKELGLFPMDDEEVEFINIDLKDGAYDNLLGGKVIVKENSILTSDSVILKY